MNAAVADLHSAVPFVRALVAGHAAAAASLPEGGPGWLAEVRREHLQAFLRGGLPGAREERWKYMPLRALERRAFAPGDADAAHRPIDEQLLAQLAGIEGPRLVLVNGQFRPDLSSLQALPQGLELRPLPLATAAGADPLEEERLRRIYPALAVDSGAADAFVQVNTAFASDGAVLRIAAGIRIEAPVQLVCIGAPADGERMWNVRVLVELGAGAQLTLVERHLDSGAPAHLGNVVTRIELAEGARLWHLRLQQAGSASTLVARTDVAVGAGAHYRPVALELGAALSRHEWVVALAGKGAALSLRGVVLASARQLLDTRLSVVHEVGATQSDTLWRAIAGGRARCAFHGGIVIDEGADGSAAALQTKSLLLAEGAEIDAQPVLEIHADEVQASHGAAIGQLDATALFYLQTRGIPERQARHLLIDAFCAAVLQQVDWDLPVDAPSTHPLSLLRALLPQAISARLAELEGGR